MGSGLGSQQSAEAGKPPHISVREANLSGAPRKQCRKRIPNGARDGQVYSISMESPKLKKR